MLNRTSLPSDIIAFVVFCRLWYRLTLRDLSEIMALRGIEVSHGAVRGWEGRRSCCLSLTAMNCVSDGTGHSGAPGLAGTLTRPT